MLRVEHDLNRRFTLRNQTRYNRAERDAIISAIQNPAAYDSVTELVTIARQGSVRENEIVSNQTGAIGRFSTGALQHSSSFGLEFTQESQFAPTLTGLGTRAPVNVYSPIRTIRGELRSGIVRRVHRRQHRHGVPLFLRHRRLRGPLASVGGARWEHYDTDFISEDASGLVTADLEADDSLVSGKLGVAVSADPGGECLRRRTARARHHPAERISHSARRRTTSTTPTSNPSCRPTSRSARSGTSPTAGCR